jgi:hypothetical protein
MHSAIKKYYHAIIFTTIKLPLIYLTLAIGFIFQFFITFPYMLVCIVDGRSIEKKMDEKKAGRCASSLPSVSVKKFES